MATKAEAGADRDELERQMMARWVDFSFAEREHASVAELEHRYNAYLTALDAYVAHVRRTIQRRNSI